MVRRGMKHAGQAYTHTIWKIKPGKQEEFILRWTELADWTALQGLSGKARLLRDLDDPNRFVSFGPWDSVANAKRWRSLKDSHEHLKRLQEVLEDQEPRLLEVVVER